MNSTFIRKKLPFWVGKLKSRKLLYNFKEFLRKQSHCVEVSLEETVNITCEKQQQRPNSIKIKHNTLKCSKIVNVKLGLLFIVLYYIC